MENALRMITSGAMIGAIEAHRLGLIDEIAEGDDIRAAGLAFAQDLNPGDNNKSAREQLANGPTLNIPKALGTSNTEKRLQSK